MWRGANGGTREAVATWLEVDDPADAGHTVEDRLPGEWGEEATALVAQRRRLESSLDHLRRRQTVVARNLVKEQRLSLGDAATSLGISKARVAQLVDE